MAMTQQQAAHLLRRAGFGGGTAADAASLAALDRSGAVDKLLNAPVPVEVVPPEFSDDTKSDYDQMLATTAAWLERMAYSTSPIVEKMTLFWHGHFTSGYDKVYPFRTMYDQVAFYRSQALGDFRALTQGMAIQPAMLMYLDGDYNTKGHPNQNFARELMELFTLGIGNYTEQDVIEGARAWTGYNLGGSDNRTFEYRDSAHDKGNKTIFGITKNWDGPMMIDEILSGSKKATMARFIARKLWEFFAHPNPPAGVVDALATVLLDNGLQLKPLMRALFMRDEFYAPAATQGLVRTPIEYAASMIKALGLHAKDVDLQWHLTNQGQEPFNPPNVAGWKSNGYWISTSSAAARAAFAWHVLDRTSQAKLLPDFTKQTPDTAVSGAFSKVTANTPSATTTTAIRSWLTSIRGSSSYYGDERFDLMFLVLMSPDLQLA